MSKNPINATFYLGTVGCFSMSVKEQISNGVDQSLKAAIEEMDEIMKGMSM